jgi:hypothetical protein
VRQAKRNQLVLVAGRRVCSHFGVICIPIGNAWFVNNLIQSRPFRPGVPIGKAAFQMLAGPNCPARNVSK